MRRKIIAILLVGFMLTSTLASLIGGEDDVVQEEGLQQDNNSVANETPPSNESLVPEWESRRVWCPDCNTWH
ncbi:MAG: hypothetical protein LRZ87_01465 [Methanocellales archaeon]|nr:hypothetical protein [Methanocellales archaeon]